MAENFEIDIKVPNKTRYLSLIGKIGEDIARTLKEYDGDRSDLAYFNGIRKGRLRRVRSTRNWPS